MTVSPNQNKPLHFIDVHDLENRVAETVAKVSSGEQEFVITQDGKPVSRLTRYEPNPQPKRPKQTMVFGEFRDQIEILGDIVGPMPEEWYAKEDDSDEELF